VIAVAVIMSDTNAIPSAIGKIARKT